MAEIDDLDVIFPDENEDEDEDGGVVTASSSSNDSMTWYLKKGTEAVTLSDYGITYEGTAVLYDTITVTVAEE